MFALISRLAPVAFCVSFVACGSSNDAPAASSNAETATPVANLAALDGSWNYTLDNTIGYETTCADGTTEKDLSGRPDYEQHIKIVGQTVLFDVGTDVNTSKNEIDAVGNFVITQSVILPESRIVVTQQTVGKFDLEKKTCAGKSVATFNDPVHGMCVVNHAFSMQKK